MFRLARMVMLVAALGAGALLASCASTKDPTTGATTSTIDPSLSNAVTKIKAAVIKACGYSATVDSIAAIVGTFVPGVNLVGSVTDSICKAVTALGVRQGISTPQVNGVPVVGRFVR